MKNKTIYALAAILVLSIAIVSCKRDRGPRLIVTVQEEDGTRAPNALVHAWYGPNTGQPGSVLNDVLMNQTKNADAAGEAVFDFRFSAVLDVDVIYYKQIQDSLNPTIFYTDTMYGHQVVKVEQIRQKSKENNYYANVTVE